MVLDAVAAGRSLEHGSGRWTHTFITIADAMCEGRWTKEVVPGSVLLDVWLPPHAGEPCHGDTATLIAPGGASVRQAAADWRRIRDTYAIENGSCSQRLEEAATAPLSLLVLTRRPILHELYASVAPGQSALHHLDGLHRLVAWAAVGRLTSSVAVPCWIADCGDCASARGLVPPSAVR